MQVNLVEIWFIFNAQVSLLHQNQLSLLSLLLFADLVEEINILLPQFELKEVLSHLGGYGHYFQDSQEQDVNHQNTANTVQGERVKDGPRNVVFEETKNNNDIGAFEVQLESDGDSIIYEIVKSTKKSHKPIEKYPSVCSDCGKMFFGDQLKKHKHKMHSNLQRKYFCDKCDLSFNLPSDLRRHKINHEEPKFKCDKCFKFFKTKFNLRRHTKFCN